MKELECWKRMKRPLSPNVKNNRNKHTTQIVVSGQLVEKPKRRYSTLKDAFSASCLINTDYKTIHEVVPYKCKTCGGYHIGRTPYVLDEKDKRYIKEKIKDPQEVTKILNSISKLFE